MSASPDFKLPKDLEACLVNGAARLGRALDLLDYPNAGRPAPCHEVNAVINISYYLGQEDPPYLVYAEGTIATRGRIDLVGFNETTAFALEAKSFGPINARGNSMLADFSRLKKFYPALSEVAGNVKANRWWDDATHRWGIIVISSFRGSEIKDAWLSEHEEDFRQHMGKYAQCEQPQEADGKASGFLALFRAVPFAQRGAAPITTGARWKDCGEGWLLWAAVPIGVDDHRS